jgi:glutathione reductase (NADPH)
VFGKRPVEVDPRHIPTAVFSQPEVGTVGLTESRSARRSSHVDIYKADFRPIKATMSGRDTRVLMKLVVDGRPTACSAATSSATPPPRSSRRSRSP